ncbi:hypothetical protein D0862_03009 [Hortaea werneckii]|uniref:Phosphatidic acid phosphatase type 2/haloperoxidase domain-containing protein n=1 Tax=Hortaea werneckii TaxID=91943 RepID=A0A3M7HDP0_HORWE|nr:hypothetical protein D0862_03009 [Hortaea werneckii]
MRGISTMALFQPHTVISDDTTAAIVSGEQTENQSRKPNQTKLQHNRTTNNRQDHSIIEFERPPFGQWLKAAWPDLLTMVIVGAVGLGDGTIVFPEFAYPLRREVVPIWAATLLASLAPIAVILIMQLRIRSFWDAHNAIVGLLYSLITAAVFQVFLKWLVGGLRPHFLAVCKPKIPINDSKASGNGFDGVMYDRSWCTGDKNEIEDSLESFPSGHTTAAFAGFVYLYLYLNAKLKVWSNYHPAYWKLIVTYIPILGAVLIGGALTIDEFHNWYDIIAGAAIGTVMAVSAFRMVYASVWDFRYNHIPLMRHRPSTCDGNSSALTCFHDPVWTREAGWGTKATGV